MNTTKLFPYGGILCFVLMLVSSCKKEASPEQETLLPNAAQKPASAGFITNDMVLYWNEKAAAVINAPMTPPSQSRYFAMIQIAVHDALNSIKPKYETYALKDVHKKDANPDAAVATAAYLTIKGLAIPGANNQQLDDWYAQSLATISDDAGKQAGITLGTLAATAILANRANDNFAQANIQVPRPEGVAPGEYRSTLPFSNPGMPKIKALHQWGTLMTPFVIESNSQFRPVAPYPVTSSEYTMDYNEVKAKGARVGSTRTADETQIGQFWAERAPLGWNRLARNMIAQKKMDAWRTARLLVILHTAMMDDITACFEAKYYYFYWRPETAIRMGDNDGNNQTAGDPNWLPSYTETPNLNNPTQNVYTPPIPDYPSAHASYGGAAAEVLKLFFDTDMISVDQTSPTTPGVTRHYSSLSQAARDNSLSRIFVGYHFRNAVMKGEQMGREIGAYVFEHAFKESGE